MDAKCEFIGNIDVGNRISEKLRDIGMSKAELSRALGMNQSNLNKLLNKNSIETSKLVEISKIMKYNFFKEFCMTFEYRESLLKAEDFYITDANIGVLIEKRIKELGLTQKEVADKVSKAQSDMIERVYPYAIDKKEVDREYRQQYVSTITKRSSINTTLLWYLSLALEYNFFECFCKRDESPKESNQKLHITLDVYNKVQSILFEKRDLERKVNVLRHIIKTISITEEELKKLGVTDKELKEADINAEEYELIPEDAVSIFV